MEQAEQGRHTSGVAIGEQNAVIEADDLVAITHQVGQVIPFERTDDYFAISRNNL